MTYNPNIHRRRSIRLQGYDYSRAGAYYVTLCTQNRECLFGEIKNGKMVLNDAGRMVQIVHDEMRPNYPGVETDDFIVMPNHIHGIIILVGAGHCACPDNPCACSDGPCACPNGPRTCSDGPRACPDGPCACSDGPRACPDTGQPRGVAPTLSLPDVVHQFKTMTTKRYTDGVDNPLNWQSDEHYSE